MGTCKTPPVCLTFLAPSKSCNQSCPGCFISAVGNEPVTSPDLSPSQYALLLESFIEAGIPVGQVSFQGYEVTMPESWPYVEAVFDVAKKYRIVDRGFVTNGMLLHNYTDRVVHHRPNFVAVSLDAADPEINNRIRGHQNAFALTLRGIQKFLEGVPEEQSAWYKSIIHICSTLYDEENFRSLLKMPKLLREIGVYQWSVTQVYRLEDDKVQQTLDKDQVRDWFRQLWKAAYDEGINFFTGDEFGALDECKEEVNAVKNINNTNYFYRVYPTGHICQGKDLLTQWTPERDYQWDPTGSSLITDLGFEAPPWLENLQRTVQNKEPNESVANNDAPNVEMLETQDLWMPNCPREDWVARLRQECLQEPSRKQYA